MSSDPEELGYRVTYTQALQEIREKLGTMSTSIEELKSNSRQASTDSADLKQRVRSLELRFYGILAGLITAIAILIYQGGGLNGG